MYQSVIEVSTSNQFLRMGLFEYGVDPPKAEKTFKSCEADLKMAKAALL